MSQVITSDAENIVKYFSCIKDLKEFFSADMKKGMVASVMGYHDGVYQGGGHFTYDPDTITVERDEDGYLNFSASNNRTWRRINYDLNSVTVCDFGAIADGKTDCIDAVKKMFKWSKANAPSTGIRFPRGSFYLSGFDNSSEETQFFKVTGPTVQFGHMAETTLILDTTNNDVIFKVKSRYVEINGLKIEGGCLKEDEPSNTTGFFKNIITGGQFARVSCVMFNNVGGRCLDLIDTLDCKIDQFYGRYCKDSIVYARWSDQEAGAWDHSTAIELTNFNIQFSNRRPALDLPRCTQSFIYNGWIEHSKYPGDLTNGQWTIEGLAIESSSNPLKLGYCRALIIQKSIHNESAGFDFSTEGVEEWTLLSEYDRGVTEVSDFGTIIQGSLSYDVITSQHHLDNRKTGEPAWFLIGDFNFSDMSSQIHVRIVGTASWSSMSQTQNKFDLATPEGVAHIYLQAGNGSSPMASWYGEGASPVLKAHIEGNTARCSLYVKIASYTGWCTALVETNGRDRYQAGVSFKFRKKFQECDEQTAKELEEKSLTSNVFEQHWTGNAQVGFGYNNNHELLLSSQVLDANAPIDDSRVKSNKYLNLRVNGELYSIELTPPRKAS